MEITKEDLFNIGKQRYCTENIIIRPVFFSAECNSILNLPNYQKRSSGFFYFKKLRIVLHNGDFSNPQRPIFETYVRVQFKPETWIHDMITQHVFSEGETTFVIDMIDVFCDLISLQHTYEYFAIGYEVTQQN